MQWLQLVIFKGGYMATISDIIEEFILSALADDDLLQLSRNDLATFFSCAPSQINYVLSTRFTPEKGFIIESKRGGGGCINLIRITDDKENVLKSIYNYLCEEGTLEYNKLLHILERLEKDGIIDNKESELLKITMSDKALANPVNITARLRAQMLKEIVLNLSKRS